MAIEKVVGKITGLGARGKQIMKSTGQRVKDEYNRLDNFDKGWVAATGAAAGIVGTYSLMNSDKQ